MPTRKTLTAAAVVAATLAVPSPALAAQDNALRGAPQIRIAAERATLSFTTDDRLARTSSGKLDLTIRFADGRRVSGIKPAGRHGSDFRYTARISSGDELRPGRKYTVRFAFHGQEVVARLVKAHAVGA